MRTIAVLNQKGGVGKTTTVANVAAALAASGARVVVIDLDPQAHLTIHLGIEPEAVESGAYRVLTGGGDFESEIMMVRPNLWVLAANINLVGAESELVSVVGRETILREAIEGSKGHFDYCLIDCAPSLGLLTLNALAASDEILIPLQPHFLALQGFGKLLQTVELVNRRINTELRVRWILLCMYDSRASLTSEVEADIEQFLAAGRERDCAWSGAQLLPVHIRRNIKLAEAPSYGQTIFEYEENCHGAEDYAKVAEFISGKAGVEQEEETVETVEQSVEVEPSIEIEQCAAGVTEYVPPLQAESPPAAVEPAGQQVPIEIKSVGPLGSETPSEKSTNLVETPPMSVEGETEYPQRDTSKAPDPL